jgi:serine/threonine protein kinase
MLDTPRWVGPDSDPDAFQLIDLVSDTGGEGEVWRATRSVDGVSQTVAIKVIHSQHITNIDEWARRWERQKKVLSMLADSRVVRILDVFLGQTPHAKSSVMHSQRTLYLVMEWIDGKSLEGWRREHPQRSLRDCVVILEQLAGAISYLHDGRTHPPVLHRDIKEGNVMIAPSGRAVLVDFGMCRLEGASEMTIVHTEGYISPEARSGNYSFSSDVFALGATAFKLFTDSLPTGDYATDCARLRSSPVLCGSDQAAFAVMSMLSPDPMSRPTDLEAWARSLVDPQATVLLGQGPATMLDTSTTSPDTPSSKSPKRRRKRGALLVLALVVAALLATAVRAQTNTLIFAEEESLGVSASATSGIRPTTTVATTTSTSTTTSIARGQTGSGPSSTIAGSVVVELADFVAGTYSGSGEFASDQDADLVLELGVAMTLDSPLTPASVPGPTAPELTIEFPDFVEISYMGLCKASGFYEGIDRTAGYRFRFGSCGFETAWLSGSASSPVLLIQGLTVEVPPESSKSGQSSYESVSGTATLGENAVRQVSSLPSYSPGPYSGTAIGLDNFGPVNVAASLSGELNPTSMSTSEDGLPSQRNELQIALDLGQEGSSTDYRCDITGVLVAISPINGYRFLSGGGECFGAKTIWLSGPSEAPIVRFDTDAGSVTVSLARV